MDLLTALIVGLALCGSAMRSKYEAYCWAVFTVPVFLHDLFFADRDGFPYYASAAFFNFIVVMLLFFITPVTKLALSLQKISFLSILVNLGGYILWVNYIPPTLYNGAFLIVYLLAIVALLRKGGYDVLGGSAIRRRHTGFRPFGAPKLGIHHKDQDTI